MKKSSPFDSYLQKIEHDAREKVSNILKNKELVHIYHNNENGMWMYSVCLKNEPEFWLDSFTRKKDAVSFCKKNNLPCDKEILGSKPKKKSKSSKDSCLDSDIRKDQDALIRLSNYLNDNKLRTNPSVVESAINAIEMYKKELKLIRKKGSKNANNPVRSK